MISRIKKRIRKNEKKCKSIDFKKKNFIWINFSSKNLFTIFRKQIQEALNQQTYPHFKAYSEQQHPNNLIAVCVFFH